MVQSHALVGRHVRVRGRCLTTRTFALGSLSFVRHEWQLEADGVVVLVVGPLPAACSASDGMTSVTITALVAEDTLPALGDLPPSPRRYLVLSTTRAD